MVSFLTLCAVAAGFEAPVEAGATVLVTGATGRTGSLLYAKLKADSRVGTIRALVTSLDKARSTRASGRARCEWRQSHRRAGSGEHGERDQPQSLRHVARSRFL